jgi:hypothetical protein
MLHGPHRGKNLMRGCPVGKTAVGYIGPRESRTGLMGDDDPSAQNPSATSARPITGRFNGDRTETKSGLCQTASSHLTRRPVGQSTAGILCTVPLRGAGKRTLALKGASIHSRGPPAPSPPPVRGGGDSPDVAVSGCFCWLELQRGGGNGRTAAWKPAKRSQTF